jgi:hypothetical protein
VWSVVRQRDREQQLLWTGAEVRRAIGHYYHSAPGGLHRGTYRFRQNHLLS